MRRALLLALFVIVACESSLQPAFGPGPGLTATAQPAIGAITVAWLPVPEAASYDLRVGSVTDSTTGTSLSFTGLEPVEHSIRVEARNGSSVLARADLRVTPLRADLVPLSAPAWVGSGQTGGGYGYAIACVGDGNEDGRTEFAVGEPWADTPAGIDSGRFFLYQELDGSVVPLTVSSGSTAGDNLGASFTQAALHRNDDDDPEMFAGAPRFAQAGGNGRVYEFEWDGGLVKRTGFGAGQSDDLFGIAVVAGPVFGPVSELLCGAASNDDGTPPNNNTGTIECHTDVGGSVSNVYGNSGAFLAAALALADVNDDGYLDILAGAPGVNFVSIWMGAAGGGCPASFGPPDTTLAAGANGFGRALAVLGTESSLRIAIGAPLTAEGIVRIGVRGPQVLPDVLASTDSGGQFGAALAGGDVNGDGWDDLLVGAPAHGTDNMGRAALFLGSAGTLGLTPVAAWETFGQNPDASLGAGLAICDVDGDGSAEVLAGSPGIGPKIPPTGTPAGLGRVRMWWGPPRRGPEIKLSSRTYTDGVPAPPPFEITFVANGPHQCFLDVGDGPLLRPCDALTHAWETGTTVVRLRVLDAWGHASEAVATVEIP